MKELIFKPISQQILNKLLTYLWQHTIFCVKKACAILSQVFNKSVVDNFLVHHLERKFQR